MRTLITIFTVFAFLATGYAQSSADPAPKKKVRTSKVTPAETSVSETGTAPKAGCCAHKSAGKADASTGKNEDGSTAATSADEAAPKAAGCCAGKSAADKASCHDKAEGHTHAEGHDHDHGDASGTVAPASAVTPVPADKPND